MQMIYCPNCQKLSGFKRALGFGTFFIVLLTAGIWLLIIPFYPARCITCGLTRHEALPRITKVLLGVLGAAVLILVAMFAWDSGSGGRGSHQPAPIVRGPDHNEAPDRNTPNIERTSQLVQESPIYKFSYIESQYDDNEVRAESLFKGSRHRFWGPIESITTDISGNAHVAFPHRIVMFSAEALGSDLDCEVDTEQANALQPLHKGSVVVMSGEGNSKIMGTVFFRQCSLERTISPEELKGGFPARPAADDRSSATASPATFDNSREVIYTVGGDVSPPKATFTPEATYTDEARKANLHGVCALEFVVGTDGHTRDIRVTQPLGMGLDERAVEAIQRWQFEPAMKDGKPVAVKLDGHTTFRLNDGDNPPASQ